MEEAVIVPGHVCIYLQASQPIILQLLQISYKNSFNTRGMHRSLGIQSNDPACNSSKTSYKPRVKIPEGLDNRAFAASATKPELLSAAFFVTASLLTMYQYCCTWRGMFPISACATTAVALQARNGFCVIGLLHPKSLKFRFFFFGKILVVFPGHGTVHPVAVIYFSPNQFFDVMSSAPQAKKCRKKKCTTRTVPAVGQPSSCIRYTGIRYRWESAGQSLVTCSLVVLRSIMPRT